MMNTTERDLMLPQEQSDVILSVNNVSKRFCRDLKRSLFYGIQDITSEVLGVRSEATSLRPKEFWALKDVNVELRQGQALGLIGKNGSGKSTLLRIISGLIKPDTGSIEVTGLIAPLIALGAGFNPILTGRENIFANMSILGLTNEQIRDRFNDVVDFAEIGEAIDAPLQTYSSGMAARLGFSCAIYTEPDILLIDEVLAVGDVKFRGKCYRRLAKLREKGISFILVSHSPNSILSLCETAVYLSKGQMIMAGDTHEVMRKYESDLFTQGTAKTSGTISIPQKAPQDSQGVDITGIYFRDKDGNRVSAPESGEPAYFCIECNAQQPMNDININLAVKERYGEGDHVLSLSTRHDDRSVDLVKGNNEIRMEMPFVCLRPSSYIMNLHVRQGPFYILDSYEGFEFDVEGGGGMSQCQFYQPRHWTAVPLLAKGASNS
ncbi:ABC transporter ATP-binding protein [Phormidium tenue FACHB-886]|nr:ABC transporter ATP-binding protein [Phormidium tenue FACHB-886]